MRAQWNRQDFELATRGNLGFTSEQVELIRGELVERMMEQESTSE